MSIMLTKKGLEQLKYKLSTLINVERPIITKRIEEIRPIGVVEDDTEYMQVLESQSLMDKKIIELSAIINNSIIFEKTMCKDDTVTFGSTVCYVNCDNNVEKSYTIVSVYESDIQNGLISVEAPLVRNMLGLHSGDIFEFNDCEYEIVSIKYVDSIFE